MGRGGEVDFESLVNGTGGGSMGMNGSSSRGSNTVADPWDSTGVG
jgi:hypothetical protein